MSIGATTRAAGNFTTLESNGQTRFTAGIASTNTTTGTLVVTGGVGISGALRVGGAINGGTSISTSSLSSDTYTFSSGVTSGLRQGIAGFSVFVDAFNQFITDTQTDFDITSDLWPFSNGYSFVVALLYTKMILVLLQLDQDYINLGSKDFGITMQPQPGLLKALR